MRRLLLTMMLIVAAAVFAPAASAATCTYKAGDRVDYIAEDEQWYAARILKADAACNYQVEYYAAVGAGRVQTDVVDVATENVGWLRAPTIKAPKEAAAEPRTCPPGGTSRDFPGNGLSNSFKRKIIADLSRQRGALVSVYFNTIKLGGVFEIRDGGTFLNQHPDAAIGGKVYPLRVTTDICVATPEKLFRSRYRYDYSCYLDRFKEPVCRQDAANRLE